MDRNSTSGYSLSLYFLVRAFKTNQAQEREELADLSLKLVAVVPNDSADSWNWGDKGNKMDVCSQVSLKYKNGTKRKKRKIREKWKENVSFQIGRRWKKEKGREEEKEREEKKKKRFSFLSFLSLTELRNTT
ncbi:hypothetical protein QVD17_31888 [Tagetes erecta]|uniref:Uncharacterized protein n=1 Tax=Tagetes erecta TaxID=13708 RepID=A0AAD8NHG9_TARER|nr:hypothetical protein QVD17_31888 [Tagetes erecta]